MDDLIFIINIAVKILLYISIAVLFFRKKGTDRLLFALAILAVHVVLFTPELQDDVVINTFILLVILAFNIPLWISREVAIALVIIILFLPLQQYFWMYLIAQAFYVITIGGIILAAGEQPTEKAEETKPGEAAEGSQR